ncbi:uncharacterized protein At5g65660-like [Typha angustifolia]|uniref:uncharacterized protein At5g65660-like n=1 Tax=Typha angustifolia TaxID=59011 RepID=UPI003C2F9A29
MEGPSSTSMNSSVHSSTPTLGFPLGTALLLIVLFCLSGVFSCCYHWEKLRFLRDRHRRDETLADEQQQQPRNSTSKISTNDQIHKQETDQSLPVIMPGDEIPKFMAWPCPCQATLPTEEKC